MTDWTSISCAAADAIAANGPAWATKIRALYGDQADDVLEMILGDAA